MNLMGPFRYLDFFSCDVTDVHRVSSMVDEGWYLLSTVLNFGVVKKIQTPRSLIWDFGAHKTSITCWSGAEFKLEPLQLIWQSLPSGNHSRNLFQNTIEGFDCKINGLALGPRSGTGRTAWAGVTGERKHRRFRVGASCCGQRPARLRKASYHFCDTGSFQESTRF